MADFWQFVMIGLVTGSLYALIALGYTMVYGIIELINFAHGDLFMLGGFMAYTLFTSVWFSNVSDFTTVSLFLKIVAVISVLIVSMLFCAVLNWSVDRIVYKPLRNAPKLAPFVSAIGVSFIFMNIGLFWRGSIPADNLLAKDSNINLNARDVLVAAVTLPLMIALTVFVKSTKLGKAMRATAQNPMAAQLMGIDTNRVIGVTFLIGGALAGAGSVIYALKIGTIQFTMGFQNGLYAFTAAVLGGIGNIPGAVLGGLLIGLIRSLGSGYIGENWTGALIFATLIVVLVFRPSGLLGARVREKV
jgi:branched-chain amino acid transport system permease protein